MSIASGNDVLKQDYYVTQTITVLGSTGSIGVSTLDVLERHPDKFKVFALTADTSAEKLFTQCIRFQPAYAVLRDAKAADKLREQLLSTNCTTEVLSGDKELVNVAADTSVDTVMAAIVGAAGLLPTLAAVKSGKKVLLANKEALVMAGGLFMEAVKIGGAALLPIDSEHNAIFQCLPKDLQCEDDAAGIRRLLLTGSGGPFRSWSAESIARATPEQACNHPNWSMGKKISVDSATLMNKGLEFIEARWLFNISPSKIEVVIHPQSVIHSMVEYIDGSVLAQLGHPDMRTPIAHALAWPNRIYAGVGGLDLIKTNDLQFEAPDHKRFPALDLAIQTASASSGASTVLNAANEIAVEAFLERRIGFNDISHLLIDVMSNAEYGEPDSIDAVLDLDLSARKAATKLVEHRVSA
ncbi:MAG: 1-deoxy-D-xylulose-5-phosphate reductoisomerase [Cellvibrionaceae bacterium]